MAKQALEGTRLNAFGMDPDDLTIIGLDTNDGAEHPLYDERVKLKLDEGLVQNVMMHGVIEAVTVTKDPDGHVLVVVGRQRVRAAREANRRLKAAGRPNILVPTMTPRKGEMATFFGIMLSENENRQGDAPLVKARKAAKYMSFGHTEAEACVVFGVSRITMTAWLKLLELEPSLVKAVERQEISASQALEKAGAGSEAQKALAEEVRVKAKASPGKKRPKAKARPGKVKIQKMYESIAEVGRLKHEARALSWVLGTLSDEELTG